MTEAFQRVGLIINATAGRHPAHCFLAATQALVALGAGEVITGPGELGENAIIDSGLGIEICSIGSATGRDATRALARALAGYRLDTVIVIGGDGTMADVAGVFSETSHQPNILGIGAGTTNAGALITCVADDVSQLDAEKLILRPLDMLVVSIDGVRSAVAFNDCVFSTTVVGTLNGKLIDLDASALLAERCEPGEPKSIASAETLVRIVGPGCNKQLSAGHAVGTIIVGFAEQAFRAKAVTGGICLATHVGLPAGCLVADRPIAYFGATAESLLDDGPMHTTFMGLDADSEVIVSGALPGSVVCADGNPVAQLTEVSVVQIQIKLSAITSLAMQEKES